MDIYFGSIVIILLHLRRIIITPQTCRRYYFRNAYIIHFKMVISSNQNNHRSNSSSMQSTSTSTSTSKPTYQKVGKNSLKKLKFHSKTCEDASKQERIFLKLDPKNSQSAHKIQQRRKAITKGKNTVGYDKYIAALPKEQRQKRSMVTPSTPDHTLDIPNKKWNGMVRSWYVSKLLYRCNACFSTNRIIYHVSLNASNSF